MKKQQSYFSFILAAGGLLFAIGQVHADAPGQMYYHGQLNGPMLSLQATRT